VFYHKPDFSELENRRDAEADGCEREYSSRHINNLKFLLGVQILAPTFLLHLNILKREPLFSFLARLSFSLFKALFNKES